MNNHSTVALLHCVLIYLTKANQKLSCSPSTWESRYSAVRKIIYKLRNIKYIHEYIHTVAEVDITAKSTQGQTAILTETAKIPKNCYSQSTGLS